MLSCKGCSVLEYQMLCFLIQLRINSCPINHYQNKSLIALAMEEGDTPFNLVLCHCKINSSGTILQPSFSVLLPVSLIKSPKNNRFLKTD